MVLPSKGLELPQMELDDEECGGWSVSGGMVVVGKPL